jgi:hypothetical protein
MRKHSKRPDKWTAYAPLLDETDFGTDADAFVFDDGMTPASTADEPSTAVTTTLNSRGPGAH